MIDWIVCNKKNVKEAQEFIINKINEWAMDEGLSERASIVETEYGMAIGVEEFGYESAIRFSSGGHLSGDDWDLSWGPRFDLDKSSFYLEPINAWSFQVCPN